MATTTMEVLGKNRAFAKDNPSDKLFAAGEVLDLTFENKGIGPVLSLRAAKMLHLLVNAAGGDACELMQHTLPISLLNEHFRLSADEFLDTCSELFMTEVRLNYRTKTGRIVQKRGPMLSDVERPIEDDDDADGPALIRWEFSPVLRLVLSGSTHWAALSKKALLAFESRYSLRLYEILAIRKGLTHKRNETFSIEELRDRLGIGPDKLKSFGDVRKYALDRAVAEVNHLTGLKVSYETRKHGRGGKVSHVILHWEPGDASEREAAARELGNLRTGRKARREGTVEEVAPAGALPGLAGSKIQFPTDSSIRGTPFEKVAHDELPQPRRNLDLVQNDFISWARRDSKPLSGSGVMAMFAGFCRTQYKAT